MNKQKKQVSKKDIKTPKKDAKPTETKKSPQPSKRSDDSQKETKKKVTKQSNEPSKQSSTVTSKREKQPLTVKKTKTVEDEPVTDPSKAIIPCKAKIEFFPSRNELLQHLTDFIGRNQYSESSYKVSNGDNIINITFKNSNICFEFVKELNVLKMTNSLYSKIRIDIVFDFKSPKKHYETNKTVSSSSVKKTKKNYLSAKTPLLISEPYIDQYKLNYQEYVKGKSKWISPKGFLVHSNTEKNEELSEIGTYVLRSPAKYNFNNFKFRDSDKNKWIDKKGFIIKRSDLI